MIGFKEFLSEVAKPTSHVYDARKVEAILKKNKWGGSIGTSKDLDGGYKVSIQPLRDPSKRQDKLLKNIVFTGFDSIKDAQEAAKEISRKYGDKYDISYARLKSEALVEKADDSIEKIVSALKDNSYSNRTIIKVLDALGKSKSLNKKQIHAALKKAKVKDKDISVVTTAALNEETE